MTDLSKRLRDAIRRENYKRSDVDRLHDLLAEAADALDARWQTIATAPKDGSLILAYWPPIGSPDSWTITKTWWLRTTATWETPDSSCPEGDPDAPTHWQPLPPPPDDV